MEGADTARPSHGIHAGRPISHAIGVPQSLGCVVAEWEFAHEREDRIWLRLMKAFARVIVLAAFLYAARPFVRRVIRKEA